MLPKLITIVGPTASGKTALGILIAKLIDGEVISADSRVVYKGMDIGTAKPEADSSSPSQGEGGGGVLNGAQVKPNILELFPGNKPIVVEGVPHWGIDLIHPNEEYSVADFKVYAEQKIKEILSRGHVPILVGGTGLWVSAVVDNLDLSSTPADESLRVKLESMSLGDLFHEYKQLDPSGAEVIDRENKRRLVRALEVTLLTGKPFSQLQTKGEPKYDVLQIGMSVDREELNERINDRVEEMIAKGLVSEVRVLKEMYGGEIDAMTGIGYRQIVDFLESRPSPLTKGGLRGVCTLQDAIKEIKKDTRHYAKRQMTWFKRDKRIQWITKSEQAMELATSFLKDKEK